MKPGLTIGHRAEVTCLVEEDMCPAFDGVVVHRVYSTWSMAHQMELAARKVLAPFLEEHEEGLGTHLSIEHLAPTPVGKTIRAEAVATRGEGNRLVCAVQVYDGDSRVGRGAQGDRKMTQKTMYLLVHMPGI